ncbi:four-helix bundle copper-binding protein [Hydrogenophaga soli]
MERRDLLGAFAALAATGLTAHAQAADEHSHHHHHAAAAPYAELLAATADCVVKGQACLAHCLVLLGQGDKAMAACAQNVNQMLALCGALQNLAAQNAKLTPALAKVALDACTACEAECKKHENQHAECKACRESCTACINACKAVLA